MLKWFKPSRPPKRDGYMGYSVDVLVYIKKHKQHIIAWYDFDDKEWRADASMQSFLEEAFEWTYLPKPKRK
jgi:hypothetical protein